MSPRLDRSATTFGAVFVVIGLAVLVDELGGWDLDMGYLLPAALIAAGLALTIAALAGDEDGS
jgi:hypothetical protein